MLQKVTSLLQHKGLIVLTLLVIVIMTVANHGEAASWLAFLAAVIIIAKMVIEKIELLQ